MTCELVAVVIDAIDPARLADFWCSLLGWTRSVRADGSTALTPTDDCGFGLVFVPARERKMHPNAMHFDLTSTSLEHQQQTVATALRLGAHHIDVGQRPEEGHVVLADPEGNELCVIGPGNNFLADCGFVGALACDGSRAVGHFWSHALGWPLVWDQDEETAIRSPAGGPKISWGGTPVSPKLGRRRVRLQVAPPTTSDAATELERLLELGATRLDATGDSLGLLMADPDGNPFHPLPS
jgi:hypothetical protein